MHDNLFQKFGVQNCIQRLSSILAVRMVIDLVQGVLSRVIQERYCLVQTMLGATKVHVDYLETGIGNTLNKLSVKVIYSYMSITLKS